MIEVRGHMTVVVDRCREVRRGNVGSHDHILVLLRVEMNDHMTHWYQSFFASASLHDVLWLGGV
jgi:hypothetical protein